VRAWTLDRLHYAAETSEILAFLVVLPGACAAGRKWRGNTGAAVTVRVTLGRGRSLRLEPGPTVTPRSGSAPLPRQLQCLCLEIVDGADVMPA
jgi:hypothetical protein